MDLKAIEYKLVVRLKDPFGKYLAQEWVFERRFDQNPVFRIVEINKLSMHERNDLEKNLIKENDVAVKLPILRPVLSVVVPKDRRSKSTLPRIEKVSN